MATFSCIPSSLTPLKLVSHMPLSSLLPTQDIEPYFPFILIARPHLAHFTSPDNSANYKLTKFLYDKKGISKTATAINNILSNPIYAIADQKLYNYYKSLGANFLNDSSECFVCCWL